MSSQVVRVQSFGKGSLGGIGQEVERDERDLMEHRSGDIDKARTHMNEFFKHTRSGMYGEWKDICRDLNVSNADRMKKNMTAFEGMVITSDKAFFENMGYVPGQEPPAAVREFFQNAYDFAKQEIGFQGTDQNILTASVHYDETTPHLQLYYVPVVDSWKEKVYEKDELGKVLKNQNGSPVQARDDAGHILYEHIQDSETRRINRAQFWENKGGKSSYSRMQDRFYEQISEKHGLGRGEKGSTKEHKTKAQWEMQQLQEQRKAMVQDLARMGQELQKQEKRSEVLSKKEKAAEAKIERLDDRFKGRVMSAKELDAIKPQATLPGGIGLYKVDQINDLKKTSYAAIRYKERCVDLDKRYKTVEAENARLKPPKINISEELEKNTIRIKQEQTAKLNQKIIDRLPVPLVQETKAQIDREAAELARSISHGPSR